MMTTTTTYLDKVWRLVDKYYANHTFNNQDWDSARIKYVPNNNINNGMVNEATYTRAANKIIKSLGDKYTRLLNWDYYTAIQIFDLIGVGAMLIPYAQTKRLMVDAPPVQGSIVNLGGMKPGDYIIAVNRLNTEGRTAFNITNQISNDTHYLFITMTVRTDASNTSVTNTNYIVVCDVTMSR